MQDWAGSPAGEVVAAAPHPDDLSFWQHGGGAASGPSAVVAVVMAPTSGWLCAGTLVSVSGHLAEQVGCSLLT